MLLLGQVRIVPSAVGRDERISLLGPPAAAPVMDCPMVALEDPVDHRPSSLHSVLAGEECSIADHGVAQKPLVRCLFSGPFINQVELSLLASKLLARALDASGERDAATGGQPKAKIIAPPGRVR